MSLPFRTSAILQSLLCSSPIFACNPAISSSSSSSGLLDAFRICGDTSPSGIIIVVFLVLVVSLCLVPISSPLFLRPRSLLSVSVGYLIIWLLENN